MSLRTKSSQKSAKEAEMADLEIEESVDWFMRAEYDRLTEMLLYTKEMGQKRVQFWLTVVSAIGGLLAVIYQINGADTGFLGITTLLLFGVFILGFVVYIKLIQRTITSVEYIRAQGKIKKYFVQKKPDVAKYFFFPIADDKPDLTYSVAFKLTGSSLRLLVVVINSFLIAGIAAIIPRIVYGSWQFLAYQIIMAVSVFVLVFVLQEALTARMFKRAEMANKARIDFPSTK
ncbi:hypothetical protein ACFL0Z_03425 [Patescibacteria group bacterium]